MTNNEITKAYLGSEEVTKIYQGNTVIYEKETDYSKMPLTFEITGDGVIKWRQLGNNAANKKTIEYSINGGEWTSITSETGSTTSPSISVVSGDIVRFRGNNTTIGRSTDNASAFQSSTAGFKMYGNIMSLLSSTGFTEMTSVPAYCFWAIFNNCTGLTDASNLILPATTLGNSCYFYMFKEDYNLTTAPVLPTTTLAEGCYRSMFENCRSLVTSPELPATTLARECYLAMFYGCTGLTTAPVLSATTLAQGCYNAIFYNCKKVNNIICLATDISASYSTYNWVYGVASTGTFVTPSTTNWSTGASGIPSGWTRVDV